VKRQSGITDGGHVYLKCSNCRAILMDIFRTRPQEPEVWKLQASCPFCGDKSFVTEIQGGFHPGGYGKIKPDDPLSDIPSTIVDVFDCQNDIYTFTILKANADAKPLYQ
jgi:hypothetical protein